MGSEPVAEGQWRQAGPLGTVYAVLMRHPTRRGFWLCVGDVFAYEVVVIGRRDLAAMPLVSRDHFGEGERHPGEAYVKALHGARES